MLEKFWMNKTKLFLLGATAVILSTGCHPKMRGAFREGSTGPIRAIWVTRWDYKTPHDIKHIMNNCRKSGFNTVMFQVRGNGTAFYRSHIEPWADELGGRDPGFDPLAVACKEAHHNGMAIHAWANAIPGWRGKQPPKNKHQLYHTRPNWFWHDATGQREPLGWYNNLNPCYPEVRNYITAIMHEIIANYPVDGLHLDYLRFPNEWNDAYPPGATVPDYPRDAKTLALFKSKTGHSPQSAPQLWNVWRTEQINQLVRNIRTMQLHIKPTIKLSVAVGANPERAKKKHFQDARRWINENLLDAVFPMNYEGNMRGFDKQASYWLPLQSKTTIVMGIMFDKRNESIVSEQVFRTSYTNHHYAAFAYNSLFERLDARGLPMMDKQSRSRAALRKSLIPKLRRLASSRM